MCLCLGIIFFLFFGCGGGGEGVVWIRGLKFRRFHIGYHIYCHIGYSDTNNKTS